MSFEGGRPQNLELATLQEDDSRRERWWHKETQSVSAARMQDIDRINFP